MFVGMSNEFGEFESGVVASLLGATTAVIVGGFGTLLVVPAIALLWPQVRQLREIKPRESEVTARGEEASSRAGEQPGSREQSAVVSSQ
jgi:hypothetical protein